MICGRLRFLGYSMLSPPSVMHLAHSLRVGVLPAAGNGTVAGVFTVRHNGDEDKGSKERASLAKSLTSFI